jgi:hypothetical protein
MRGRFLVKSLPKRLALLSEELVLRKELGALKIEVVLSVELRELVREAKLGRDFRLKPRPDCEVL